jgi:hypothetical protein
VDAANLLSGLIGGLLGAVIGASVTFLAQWAEHRHQGRIAARALHAEMGADLSAVKALLRKDPPVMPLIMHAWELRAADVARILPANEFYKVAMAYGILPRCQLILDRFAARATHRGSSLMNGSLWKQRCRCSREPTTS